VKEKTAENKKMDLANLICSNDKGLSYPKKKCYEYNKPFLLLLPLTALEGKERNKLYRENGIEIIVLDKRINFMKNKNNVWFNTSWFCKGICDKQLNFEKVRD
jgi:hypothetical protein